MPTFLVIEGRIIVVESELLACNLSWLLFERYRRKKAWFLRCRWSLIVNKSYIAEFRLLPLWEVSKRIRTPFRYTRLYVGLRTRTVVLVSIYCHIRLVSRFKTTAETTGDVNFRCGRKLSRPVGLASFAYICLLTRVLDYWFVCSGRRASSRESHIHWYR